MKNFLYDKSQIDWEHLQFTGKDLRKLLIPLMLEQLLNSFMGMADTMMVSRVGPAAISAVSLTDAINLLVIQVFAAMATGGTILCSQFLGQKNVKRSNDAARQVTLTVLAISLVLTVISVVFRVPILRVTFGSVENDVMEASLIYFLITALSFPFLALFQAGSAFYRAGGNSRFPMIISVISNVMNIIGNAILIFVFHWGVAGAAISTLVSRVFCAVVVFYFLRKPRQEIVLDHYLKIRPEMSMIIKVLAIGIPSGIENGMFQFGKLAIQSSVSTLGTQAIAAQAMALILEGLNGIGGIGIAIGLMTVVGQCIGAGKDEEAKYNIVRLTKYAEVTIIVSCLAVFAMTKPVMFLAGMTPESSKICFNLMMWITIIKPLTWVPSFIPAYGLRAAGDVKYSMIVSSLTMWLLRVSLAVILIRVFHFGPIAVWIGMFTDWAARGIIFYRRFRSGKWLQHRIV